MQDSSADYVETLVYLSLVGSFSPAATLSKDFHTLWGPPGCTRAKNELEKHGNHGPSIKVEPGGQGFEGFSHAFGTAGFEDKVEPGGQYPEGFSRLL